jgi:hypothetical protein
MVAVGPLFRRRQSRLDSSELAPSHLVRRPRGETLEANVVLNRVTALVFSVICASACLPTVYQREVKTFSDGVESAVSMFEQLRQESEVKYRQVIEVRLTESLVDADVSDMYLDSLAIRKPSPS